MDGELDLVRHLAVEDHLRGCESCSGIVTGHRAIHAALGAESLYFRAPASLDQQIRSTVRAATSRPRARVIAWQPLAAAAALLLVAALGWRLVVPASHPAQDDLLARDLISSHVRSLMPGHLTDVPSSDQHTVKPGFAGRLDFSPPVVDPAGDGFPLAGGRLDYVGNRAVAALVYHRRQHTINLFVWPATGSERGTTETTTARQGYNVVRWTRGGMEFCAVSDLNAAELRQFADLVQHRQ